MSASETAPRPQTRLESIDGLRGLACLIVVLYHSCVHFGKSSWPALNFGPIHITQARLFAYGYGGVDLFFVLSGFCLAYPIVSRPDRTVDWRQYAINRIRRIIPPYWVAVVLFAAITLFIAHYRPEPIYAAHSIGWPGAHQLIYCFLLVSPAFNSSFWTLPVEWRWYFVLPILIWLWRRIGAIGVLLCTFPISLFAIFVYMPSHQERLQFFIGYLPVFMPLFGLGIWTAVIAAQTEKSWQQALVRFAPVGMLLSAFAVWNFTSLWQASFSSSGAVLRLVTFGPLCFFAVLAATQEGPIKRWLSWRPLVGIGTFSYSLYLIHEPLISLAAIVILSKHWPHIVQFGCQVLVLPALMIGLAYLFFLAFEKPFLRRPVKKAIEAEQHGIAPTASSSGAAN
jgi:peptidoglycan/LPS O-acetylase OafA/YrhL